MPLTKGEITDLALTELTYIRNIFVWRQNNHTTKGRRFIGMYGIGDISGITKLGLRVEVEVKTLGDTIKPKQREFMTRIKKYGGICLLATEENGKLVIKDFPV